MTSLWKFLAVFVLAQRLGVVHPYAINTTRTSLTLIDSRTGIVARTLFVNEATDVFVDGLLWKDMRPINGTEILNYQTFVNGKQVYEGFILLPENPSDLPTMVNAGIINANKSGKMTIEVKFWVGDAMNSATIQIQAFKKWIAILPCLAMCGIGLIKEFHILYTLFIGLFIGGCMVTGSLVDGFKSIATKYIVAAVADEHHVYLMTFTVCVAGLTAMIRRSGGISAVAQIFSRFAKAFRLSQILMVIAGLALFFDPYASIILVAEFFSPYMRFFPVSLEKQAFLLQSTGLPVSAINPLSTWVGFSSALIQSQLDKLSAMGYNESTIPDDGWTVFTRSIKYQFYPIFLLFLMGALVLSRRELGPMLITERERWLLIQSGATPPWTLREKIARPDVSTPRHVRNMVVPSIVWFAAIWTTFALVNDPDNAENATDFTAALLYCTIGVAAFTQLFFFIQKKWVTKEIDGVDVAHIDASPSEGSMENSTEEKAGKQSIIGLNNSTEMNADFILKNLATDEDAVVIQTSLNVDSHDEGDTEDKSVMEIQEECTAIVSMRDGGQCFFKGGATVIPVLMTLTLAWATTEMLLDLGVDRLFADLINRSHLKLELYPTIGFLVSFLVAFSTGSFSAAQTIVLPLLCLPLYIETDGANEELFYALVGAVLSGSVLGDQASPISTSSILSTFMIECDLRNHIVTQTPYIVVVALISLLFGHLPSGSERFPYYASYIMGFVLLGAFVYFLCQDVLHKVGAYDFITEFCCSELASLQDLKSRMRVAHEYRISKSADVLLDTDSASEDPSADYEGSNAQEDIEMEIDYSSDDSSGDGSSAASSSYYSDGNDRSRSLVRRYASAVMTSNSRSRSRTRSASRRRSSAYDQDEVEESDSESDSPNRRSTSQRSRRGERTDRVNEQSGRRATQSRRVRDESVSSGEDDSHPTTTSASENDRYTSGNDDYTTDGETKSNVTRMRTRVMKWLGHSLGGHNENDEDESQDHHASGAREGRNKKNARRQGDYRY